MVRTFPCPKCKRLKTLRKLPQNFKCADVICDFCGYLAQVKTLRSKDASQLPTCILGAAWPPQKERMEAGIYFPLFVVVVAGSAVAVYYLAADLQPRAMYVARKPLSATAKRSGWQGFLYDLTALQHGELVRLA